jgi:hypothetical protein
MLDLRGYVLLPCEATDVAGSVVSEPEIKELRQRISELSEGRIGICSEHVENGQIIIFLAGFCNHGHHALEALEEIGDLLRPLEKKLWGQFKAHVFAYDDEQEKTVTLSLGEPFTGLH